MEMIKDFFSNVWGIICIVVGFIVVPLVSLIAWKLRKK